MSCEIALEHYLKNTVVGLVNPVLNLFKLNSLGSRILELTNVKIVWKIIKIF